MKDQLGAVVTRGAESWQFFAFVFAAFTTLGLSLVESVPLCLTLKIEAKVLLFLLLFYVFMVNVRVRNVLVRVLGWLKREAH
jgi:hypothetical protein